MRVSELEARLLERFPKWAAEDWDHVGLSVGDPASEVSGVLCALDATEQNVVRAHGLGCNVLLTHHPVYIKAPSAFVPASSCAPSCSTAVYTAVKLGISIISLHTNLDRSLESRMRLASILDVAVEGSLERPEDNSALGLGLVGTRSRGLLRDLASTCAMVFQTEPRVWGDPHKPTERVAVLGGSLGSLGDNALELGADAVICGEAGYHVCQDLMLRGMGVILLGHDRSEEPFVEILADAARDAGVDSSKVNIMISSHRQWWTELKQGECL